MKKIKYYISILLMAMTFQGCFDAESERLLFTQDQTINTERSAFYAMVGILQQMQEVGDNYVIMNELRGDLISVTENSTPELREIYLNSIDSANSYVNSRSYYAIINNCNNLVTKIDTGVVISNEKSLMREMSAAKTIRAWSYWQLMLTFGKVYYTHQPITDVKNQKNYQTITDLDQLADSLIADLLPWAPANLAQEQFPDYDAIGNFDAEKLFIPVRFMLGDLYLWKGQYADAANMYYQMIRTNKLTTAGNQNKWNSTQNGYISNWTKLFTDFTINEQLSVIGFTSLYSNNSMLSMLSDQSSYLIAPSSLAIDTWESQTYSITNTLTLSGDLRGINGSYSTFSRRNELNEISTFKYISKYQDTWNYVSLCRSSLVYLRYAEALNRLGKPNIAFAFLKYGLTAINLTNYAAKEIVSKESYIDFGQVNIALNDIFKNNIGMHARGCGEVNLNNSFKLPADQGSALWVEDQLVTEYALETAFEGHRFQDLMRISRRRNNPGYLVEKVALKYSEADKAKFLSRVASKPDSWYYLPEEK